MGTRHISLGRLACPAESAGSSYLVNWGPCLETPEPRGCRRELAAGPGAQRSFPCLPPEQSWLFLVPRGVNRVRSTCLPKQQVGTWLRCAPKMGHAQARRGSTWSVATPCSTGSFQTTQNVFKMRRPRNMGKTSHSVSLQPRGYLTLGAHRVVK